jgi:hypothetical protein
MDVSPIASIGRLLIALGALMLVLGCILLLAGRTGLPLGRLPGDIAVRGKHFALYAPIATCVLISVLLSLVMWLVNHLRR